MKNDDVYVTPQGVPPTATPTIVEERQAVIDAVVKALKKHPFILRQIQGSSFLITGVLGFFGRYVVDVLLELMKQNLAAPTSLYLFDSAEKPVGLWAEYEKVGPFVCRLPEHVREKYHTNSRPVLHFRQHDVRHHIGNDDTINADPPKFIWHLAGIASPHHYKLRPWDTIAVAVDGLRRMGELAMQYGSRLLFTSSSEVYQTALQVPTPESYVGAIPSRTERSCYDVSKLMGETMAWLYHTHGGLHVDTVRIFNSFGPGMSEEDRRILPRIASAIVGKRPLKIYAAGSGHGATEFPTRTYTPVANTLLGFFLVAFKGEPGGVYNVGLTTPELSVPALVERIERYTGHIATIQVEPPSNYVTEPLRRCPDITALNRLGFEPCMELDEGLRLFFDWALRTYKGME